MILPLALAGMAAGEVFFLDNGDRVTGQLLSEGERSFRVETRHGRLVIPRTHVLRILRDDGSEVNPNPTPTPDPTPTPEPVCRLELEVTGSVFWYAWTGDGALDADPTLRLRLYLDGQLEAMLRDPIVDADAVDAPMANRFSFADIFTETAAGVRVADPVAAPGLVRLVIKLPPDRAGARRLRVGYQVNEGTESEPAFRDVTVTETQVELQVGSATRVSLIQDRGRMELSGLFKKRLKHADSFQLELRPEL